MSLLRRRLMVQSGARYIQFEDQEVKRICIENWDKDGDGKLSKDEAGQITSISDKFRNNAKIRSFMELQYFTGLQGALNSCFHNCTSLEKIAIPNGSSVCFDMFSGCKALRKVIFPHNMPPSQSTPHYMFSDCNLLEVIDFPETYTEGVTSDSFERMHATLVFRSKTVVKYVGFDYGQSASYLGESIYVPDELVENYKADDKWRNWKEKIKPLSEYAKR